MSVVEVGRSEAEALRHRGLDVRALLSAKLKFSASSAVKLSTEKVGSETEATLEVKSSTFVVGGDVFGSPLDFEGWAASVASYAMPIRAEYAPLAQFLKAELSDSFKAAYAFYASVASNSFP